MKSNKVTNHRHAASGIQGNAQQTKADTLFSLFPTRNVKFRLPFLLFVLARKESPSNLEVSGAVRDNSSYLELMKNLLKFAWKPAAKLNKLSGPLNGLNPDMPVYPEHWVGSIL